MRTKIAKGSERPELSTSSVVDLEVSLLSSFEKKLIAIIASVC